MNNIFIFTIVVIIFTACKSTKIPSNQESRLGIAYNIHEKDTINKNNYEILTMHWDGSNKQNITCLLYTSRCV